MEEYQKIRIIGKGSFGTATLHKRIKDQKLVVLKEINTSDMDLEERTTAYNEIQILSALHHKNIIKYFDSIINQESVIIVMDYADRGNLAQLLNIKKSKNDTFKEKGILFIIYQVADALTYIHQRKILHRDLKPANIFLTANGSVRIGDFGISKVLTTRSQAQTVVGTPYYLSPEMCEGFEYNEKSDIWAIGCILYEMMTLKKPFTGVNLPLLVQKIIKCEYDPISNNYCKDLKILLELILQKKATFRPTAQFIYEVIIPDILVKHNMIFDYQCMQDEEQQKGCATKERSILYEITNSQDGIKVAPVMLPHKKILDFSTSSTHSIVVFVDNTVYAWGSNKYCQLGAKNSDTFVEDPVHVKTLEHMKIVRCCAGHNFSLFLTRCGQIYNCGRGNFACLGHGNLGNVYFPILLKHLTKIVIKDIQCGNKHVVALDNYGKIYVWGSSINGQLGLDSTGKLVNMPKYVPLSEPIEKVYCGGDATVLLGTRKSIFVAGDNQFEKLSIKNYFNEDKVHHFKKINHNFGNVTTISLGDSHMGAVNSEGNVHLIGDNNWGQLGKNGGFLRSNKHVIKGDNKMIKIGCGDTFSVASDDKNILWMWGTFKMNSGEENGRIHGIKSILALYSSNENLDNGIYVKINDIKAKGNSVLLIVDTTCQPPFKSCEETYRQSGFSNLSYAQTRAYIETETRI